MKIINVDYIMTSGVMLMLAVMIPFADAIEMKKQKKPEIE